MGIIDEMQRQQPPLQCSDNSRHWSPEIETQLFLELNTIRFRNRMAKPWEEWLQDKIKQRIRNEHNGSTRCEGSKLLIDPAYVANKVKLLGTKSTNFLDSLGDKNWTLCDKCPHFHSRTSQFQCDTCGCVGAGPSSGGGGGGGGDNQRIKLLSLYCHQQKK